MFAKKCITVLFLLCACAQCKMPCTATIGGNYYDLSNMTRSEFEFPYQKTEGNTLYSVNICANCKSNCATPTPACQDQKNTAQYSLGSLNTQQFSALPNGATGVTLTYTGGDSKFCSGNNRQRQVAIQISCDTSVNNNQGKITQVSDLGNCMYQIQMTSSYACPLP